ncbi:MAG TPA: alpha/beta hydrolase [Pseudomonadales bacterium]|nr:alpha/beta hydrolase [Pseudomonadales bacterium]
MKNQVARAEDPVALRSRSLDSSRLIEKLFASVKVEPTTVNDVPCEWITPADCDDDRVLVHLHGGGYVFMGLDTHRETCCRLAEAARMRVLNVDYRLAPENPFPAALDDATSCYRWLIDEGYDPAKIAVGGDSAGGGLSLALLMNARNLGLPLPACCVMISPWTDLSLSGDSMRRNAAADPMLSREALERWAGFYLGKRDRRAPLASPLFGDLSGLPPIMIQVGSAEVLLSDAERVADKIRETGGQVSLEVWPGMFHVFHLMAARVPEGKQVIARIGEFLLNKTGASHG